jgi:hypothetical protein
VWQNCCACNRGTTPMAEGAQLSHQNPPARIPKHLGSPSSFQRRPGEVVWPLPGTACMQVAPPITFELTIRALLHALACPAAAAALVDVGAALPHHLAASYVLRQLLQVFEPGREWDQGGFGC